MLRSSTSPVHRVAPALLGRTSKLLGRAAAAAAVATVALAAPAHADFGVDGNVTASFHEPQDISYAQATAPDGDGPPDGPPPLVPDTQAGGHPDFSLSFRLNTKSGASIPGAAATLPDEALRDVDVDMPVGFYGNPQNRPTCEWDELVSDTQSSGGEKVSGFCNKDAQVGVAVIRTGDDPSAGGITYKFLAPIYNMRSGQDETAVLGFSVSSVPTKMTITPKTDGDYSLRASLRAITQTTAIYGADVVLWGDPSDSRHNRLRPDTNSSQGYNEDYTEQIGFPSNAPHLPFLTAPARCDAPLTTTVQMRSWDRPDRTLTYAPTLPARTGCDQLAFDADVSVKPTSAAAGQPSGYGIDLSVPQTNSLDSLAVPQVRDVSVRFPAGTAISPSAADGLQACSDEQLDTGSRERERCPDASKIGTASIDTPLLAEPLKGSVYLGTQKSQDPTSGEMYRAFIVGYAKGVRIKLKGGIAADPKTGQLTATFRQNPQLPFESLRLQLDDGPRAVLVNPTTCGAKTAASTVSSYADLSATSESAFAIDQECPQGGFSPAFTAGTLDPFAGGLSPFTMTAVRNDGDLDLTNLKLDLPSGLLGALSKVPVCAEAQAAAGTCDASTRLGSTTVSVGTGPNPYALPGTVSLAGPYKGAPYSLAIAVPAKAGPLDLGMVVVRSPLVIDANKAKVSAPVDDLPQIVGGVPLHYRTVSVTLDRPGFMFNATNCTASQIGATITAAGGATATPSARYQPQGCDKLKLAPSLKISYPNKSDLKKGKNTKLVADLGQTFGQAGLKRVKVTLPKVSSLQASNAKALCTPAQATARACPAASIVGRASATTPALHESLTGPVYFLEGKKTLPSGKVVGTLPKLWLKLEGDGVPLDLIAQASTDNATGRLVTTFLNIPDAPIANFRLEIDGGKNGILAAVQDPCTASRRAEVTFDGQNGARQSRGLNISAPGCGVRATVKASPSKATVRFTGIAAGKVAVSGPGLSAKSRTVKGSESATLTANVAAATRRQIASGRTVKLRIKATFDPKAKGKTVSVTKTVTIKGAKRRR